MKFQAAAHGARWRVLDGNLFALFGDFVDAVADVGDIELKIKVAWLGLPECQSRRQVCCKMLRQTRAVFDDRPAAVAHRAPRPKSPPLVVIKNLRCPCVRLIKSRNDSLACDQQYVAGESSGNWAVKISFRQRILESR